MKRGKLIVIDGTDCSGKETQTKLLVERLNHEGILTMFISFPRYNTPTGKIVGGAYLGKKEISESYFSEGAANVDPRIASAYYAADRRQALPDIEKILNAGINLVLDRYVQANMGHQGGKIKNPEERKKFYNDLDNLEYGFMQLPRPDATIFLYMPYQIGMELKKGREGDSDGHESSEEHLRDAEEAYLQLSQMYGWEKIDCAPFVNHENPQQGINIAAEEIYNRVKDILSEDHKESYAREESKPNIVSNKYPKSEIKIEIEDDLEIREIIKSELKRQKETLNLIPSENYCSKDVLAACGSVLNNKYAEGYPGKRYYQGNKYVDEAESLAIKRAKEIFGAEHVNVQPNSGSAANMAVYYSVLNRGDKVLGLDLNHGGHLTHGSPVNFSGKMYEFVSYGVGKESGEVNMDEVRELALRERPKMIVCGTTAYPRKVDFKRFKEIADEIGAYLLADISHIAGLVAGGVHESPVPYADFVTTTTHKTLRGPRSAIIMCKQKHAKAIDKTVFPGMQGGPHEHTIAAKAISFYEAKKPEFKEYADQIIKNAKRLGEVLKERGISLVSGGTDNHLLLIDLLRTESIREPGKGKEVAQALEEAGIITNANTIPFDPSTPFKPSGIRIGTPILTTIGMKENEMETVGNYIADVINNMSNYSMRINIREKVKNLCKQFPFY